jgi:hypothetical protein
MPFLKNLGRAAGAFGAGASGGLQPAYWWTTIT